MNEKIFIIIAFVGGFFIGKNWNKIKMKIMPYAEKVTQKVVSGTDDAKKFLDKHKSNYKIQANSKESYSWKLKHI